MATVPSRQVYAETFATTLFIQVCTVFQGILLARLLGPAGRGDFATIILWPNIFAGVGMLGVDMALSRFAGQGHSVERLTRTAVSVAVMTGGGAAFFCGVLLPVLLPVEKHMLLNACYWFLFFIPLNHLVLNLQGIDQGLGNFRWLNLSRAILYPVFFFGLAFCWLYASDKIFWSIVALIAANGSAAFMCLIGKWETFRSEGKSIEARTLLKESSPFILANAITLIYLQADKALLIWLLKPEEIGWYVAAFAAAGSVNTLSSSLGIVQFSTATQSQPGWGFEVLACVVRRAALFSMLGGASLALALPWLLPLVYGEAFYPAVGTAFLLLPGVVFAGLGEIFNQSLRGQGRPIAGVVSKVLGLIVMTLMSLYLADRFGGRGIACGFAVGELVAFIGIIWVAMNWYDDAAWSKLLPRKDDIDILCSRISKKIL